MMHPHKILWLAIVPIAMLVLFLGRQPSPLFAEESPTVNRLELLVHTISECEDSSVRCSLMRGMLSGLEGQRHAVPPPNWSELADHLAADSKQRVRDLASQLSQRFGDLAATQRALAVLRDDSKTVPERRSALYSLLNDQNDEASIFLESLLDQPGLEVDAIRGYAIVENNGAPKILLDRFANMPAEHRRCTLETLATRKKYAQALLKAIQRKQVAREDIPTHVARTLHDLLGDPFDKVYGKFKSVAEDREKLIAKYKKLLTPEALANANASRGRVLYNKTCAACHVLYGEGGKIGPDLTGSNRANLDYILLNCVDPSFDVPEGYRMITILTVDGRVVNGVVAEEDGNRIILKTVEQPRLVLLKEDIEQRAVAEKSMMPDGQLDAMKTVEVIDLIKYLRTTEQVEVAK